MKKRFLVLTGAALLALGAVSCDNKVCYCYHYLSEGEVAEEAVYVQSDYGCAALDQGNGGSVGSRVCVESSERLDPDAMANK